MDIRDDPEVIKHARLMDDAANKYRTMKMTDKNEAQGLDEAIDMEALNRALADFEGEEWRSDWKEILKAARLYAQGRTRGAVPEVIKPLQWHDYNDKTGKYHRAKSPAGYYEVEATDAISHLFIPYNNGRPFGQYDNPQEAKEAAQQHYAKVMQPFLSAAPPVTGGAWLDIEVTDDLVRYIGRYGGFCRDCADENGICPTKGLPCGDDKAAIRHVLTALNYGMKHGYLTPPSSQTRGG